MIVKQNVAAVILAGGQGSRYSGQDKGLVSLAGMPLYQHVARAVSNRCDTVYINANRNLADYRQSGFTVVEDAFGAFQGPVSGIVSALAVVQHAYAFILPVDTYFFDQSLLDLFLARDLPADSVRVLRLDDQVEPLVALVPLTLKDRITTQFHQGIRSAKRCWQNVDVDYVEVTSAAGPVMMNINSAEDKVELERILNSS